MATRGSAWSGGAGEPSAMQSRISAVVPTVPAASPPTRASEAAMAPAKRSAIDGAGLVEAMVPSPVTSAAAAANAAIVRARSRCGPPGSAMAHSQPPSAIQPKIGWPLASPTTSGAMVAVAARSPSAKAGRTAAISRLLRTWAPSTGAAGGIARAAYQERPPVGSLAFDLLQQDQRPPGRLDVAARRDLLLRLAPVAAPRRVVGVDHLEPVLR